MTIVPVTGSLNPDSGSIANKEQIDISVTKFDIDATAGGLVKTNYSLTALEVLVGGTTTETGSIYYTPIYKEKIDYDTWLNRINKNFLELE